MAEKKMSVDVRSEIGNTFYQFAMGYLAMYGNSFTGRGGDISLYLKCLPGSEEVNISLYGNGFEDIKRYPMDRLMGNSYLVSIVESFSKIDVDIDSFDVVFSESEGAKRITLNSPRNDSWYVVNKETGKLELHFDKEMYMSLSGYDKSEIKHTFLFSKRYGIWVSRAKFPNLWRAEEVARKLGLINRGTIGEMLSYEEQMERKAERAEARAERYEKKAEKALEKGKDLQKPIDSMHGDIAFFTQPNISSSSGRAFTRRREKMFSMWEKGFEEFKKSEYYAERAEMARSTASGTKPSDIAFCERRIADAEKAIKAQKKNLRSYESRLMRIRSGEELRSVNGELLTEERVMKWIEDANDIIDNNISKSMYYHMCIEELGGVKFSKDNIKKGYIVKHKKWDRCEVVGVGPKNFSYVILDGGAKGMGGSSSYADIVKVLSSEIIKYTHPFEVGEKYTVKEWNGEEYEDKEYTVVKVTDERVSLKSGDERVISRKPRRLADRSSESGYSWAICINENLNGTIYKKGE